MFDFFLLPSSAHLFSSVYLTLLVLFTPDMSFRETVWKKLTLLNNKWRNGINKKANRQTSICYICTTKSISTNIEVDTLYKPCLSYHSLLTGEH